METKFTIRVELHKKHGHIYTKLHENMETKRYLRIIKGSDNQWYHLPEAEYSHIGVDLKIEAVRDTAASIIETTLKQEGVKDPKPRVDYSVLVSGPCDRSWTGLEPIR